MEHSEKALVILGLIVIVMYSFYLDITTGKELGLLVAGGFLRHLYGGKK